MAIWVTSKCPRCKHVFDKLNPYWFAFGDPRIECPKCGLTVLFKNIKEWKLRSPLNRIWIVFENYTISNLVFCLPILFVIFLLIVFIPVLFGSSYNEIINDKIEKPFWITGGVIIFLAIAVYRHRFFISEVKESNERMKNREYSDQMKKLY